MQKYLGRALALACVTLAVSGSMHAQVVTADITGTTTDPTGAAVPDTKVTVTNTGTNITKVVTSDKSGNFSVTLLPPGNYRVHAEAAGFKTWQVQDLTLGIGDKVRIEPRLELGAISETVEVTAESSSIQREDSSVGSLINERAVQDLPLNGRNFIRLAQLAPGATEGAANSTQSGTRPDDRRQSSSVSVNAQDSSLNNFLIDGTDDNERFLGNVVVKPSIDAIQEMKVETNSYSAVIGRSAGGVINIVTKPGTNAIHGTIYEYFRNEVLDARPYFLTAAQGKKPIYKQNQYGGSIGGPILHDRTFYFADYERFSLRQGQSASVSVPTVAMTAGLNTDTINPNGACFPTKIGTQNTTLYDYATPGRPQFANNCIPLSRFDKAAREVASHYPVPNSFDSNGNGLYVSAPTKTQENDAADLRIDHKLSDKNSLFGRFSINDTRTYTPSSLPTVKGINLVMGSFPGPANQRAQGAQLNFTRVLSSNLVMEAKGAYTRFANASNSVNTGTNVAQQLGIPGQGTDPTSSGVPTITNGFNVGDATYVPIITKDNTYQELLSFTYAHGRHNLRFGTGFIQREVASQQSSQGRGAYTFNADLTSNGAPTSRVGGYSFASFLLGGVASNSRNVLLVSPNYGSHEGSFYFQDDWKATQKLTLNLGVREDWATPMSERYGRIANFDRGTIPAPGTTPSSTVPHIVVPGQPGVDVHANVKAYYFNFAPRVGFAYSLDDKTVIRGGFGISYYPPTMGSPQALRNAPFVSILGQTGASITPTIGFLSNGLPAPVATSPTSLTGSITAVDFNLKMQYVEQFNLTMQRDITSRTTLTVSGVGSLSRQGILSVDYNPAPPSSSSSNINNRRIYDVAYPTALGFSNGNPLGGISSISTQANWNKGEYYGLQAILQQRFGHGLSIVVQHSWAHSIDLGAPRYIFIDPKLERGDSDLDVRNRFTLLVNYQIPLFSKSHGIVAALGKGWQINAITLKSGAFPSHPART